MVKGIRGKGKKQKRNDVPAATSAGALGIQNKKRNRKRKRNPKAPSTPGANQNAGPSSDPVTATKKRTSQRENQGEDIGFYLYVQCCNKTRMLSLLCLWASKEENGCCGENQPWNKVVPL